MCLDMCLEDEIKELNINIKKLINVLTGFETKESVSSNRLIPVTKWNDYHQYPAIGGLRHIIFNEETNGASVFIKRVGRRVLIDEKKFFEWAKSDKEN